MVRDLDEFHCNCELEFRHCIKTSTPQRPFLLIAATARYTHLRDYLERCPLPCNNNSPLNPAGERRYLIIISHCHYGKPTLSSMVKTASLTSSRPHLGNSPIPPWRPNSHPSLSSRPRLHRVRPRRQRPLPPHRRDSTAMESHALGASVRETLLAAAI